MQSICIVKNHTLYIENLMCLGSRLTLAKNIRVLTATSCSTKVEIGSIPVV